VSDYSWASMHAALDALNMHSIHTYAKRIFDMAQSESWENGERTWICSCSAHTMHRFARGLRPITTCKEKKDLCCFSFSLLLNSVNLKSMKEIFINILFVFLSKFQTDDFVKSLENVQTLIKESAVINDEIGAV
jgi:hypothetical protein